MISHNTERDSSYVSQALTVVTPFLSSQESERVRACLYAERPRSIHTFLDEMSEVKPLRYAGIALGFQFQGMHDGKPAFVQLMSNADMLRDEIVRIVERVYDQPQTPLDRVRTWLDTLRTGSTQKQRVLQRFGKDCRGLRRASTQLVARCTDIALKVDSPMNDPIALFSEGKQLIGVCVHINAPVEHVKRFRIKSQYSSAETLPVALDGPRPLNRQVNQQAAVLYEHGLKPLTSRFPDGIVRGVALSHGNTILGFSELTTRITP